MNRSITCIYDPLWLDPFQNIIVSLEILVKVASSVQGVILEWLELLCWSALEFPLHRVQSGATIPETSIKVHRGECLMGSLASARSITLAVGRTREVHSSNESFKIIQLGLGWIWLGYMDIVLVPHRRLDNFLPGWQLDSVLEGIPGKIRCAFENVLI